MYGEQPKAAESMTKKEEISLSLAHADLQEWASKRGGGSNRIQPLTKAHGTSLS